MPTKIFPDITNVHQIPFSAVKYLIILKPYKVLKCKFSMILLEILTTLVFLNIAGLTDY